MPDNVQQDVPTAPSSTGLVNRPNKQSKKIADEIRSHLRTRLPLGPDVQVQIAFAQGSIARLGQVAFFELTGGIRSTLTLFNAIAKTIEFVVSNVVRSRWLGEL